MTIGDVSSAGFEALRPSIHSVFSLFDEQTIKNRRCTHRPNVVSSGARSWDLLLSVPLRS
jgi:hypothetical protein